MMRRFLICFSMFFCLISFSDNHINRDGWIKRYLSVSYPLKNVRVTSTFGSRKDPFTGKAASHSGLDLKASYEDVYAMFDGYVEAIGSDSRSGNYIILRHGNYTVSYCHLSRRYVEEGEEVLAGTPVAVSGNTGRSTGAHLHITVKKDGRFINPSILIEYVASVKHESCKALGLVPEQFSLPASKKKFIEKYRAKAVEHQRHYGIPASVTLAQMAIESDWGSSELARVGNNFFGIKANSQWLREGRPYSVHSDDTENEKFCNYYSAIESMEHHARILMSQRYVGCRKYSQTDYHGWLVALKKAGYATSPDYVRDCEKIIRQFKLYMYDQVALRA